ncbi:MAG: A24 family peptidase C-terminal domain-containing protein [Thermoplasmata archaeon]
MVGLEDGLLDVGVVLLLGGFAYAAVADLRDREVSDRLWQFLGVAGFVVGALAVAPGGAIPLALWVAVAALTLEHMFAWDERIGGRVERYADLVELVAYGGVVALVVVAALRVGVGPTGAPLAVVAVLATVVFARVLFEAGVLYGGADAKALMIAGLLVPLFPSPWLWAPSTPISVTAVLPFAVDLLMNAALVSVVIPIALAVRNAARGEFQFSRGFTGYSLPVSELPRRFVWVRDPVAGPSQEDEEEVETSEEDRQHRVKVAEALSAQGIARVWVTPQIPFLVLMAVGALTALLAGNLVVDLIRVL